MGLSVIINNNNIIIRTYTWGKCHVPFSAVISQPVREYVVRDSLKIRSYSYVCVRVRTYVYDVNMVTQ